MDDAQIQAATGAAIRRRREARGLSQEALGELCGLHRTYVGSVERGERNLSLRNIHRIAAALGLAASELIQDAERAGASGAPRS